MFIVKHGSVQLPRSVRGARAKAILKGDALPEGCLSETEIARLLALGVIAPRVLASASPIAGLPPSRGKWDKDPATLAGKDAAALRILAREIDPDVEVADLSEADLLVLLTSDYDLAFRAAPESAATDKVRPPTDKLARARAKSKE